MVGYASEMAKNFDRENAGIIGLEWIVKDTKLHYVGMYGICFKDMKYISYLLWETGELNDNNQKEFEAQLNRILYVFTKCAQFSKENRE